MELLILFAFVGGVVTILSPCILPILPIVLSGSVSGGKSRPWGVVAGFIISFTFFTLFLTAIVNALDISANVLRQIAVIILLVFGLSLLVPKLQVKIEQWFSKITPKQKNNANKNGFSGGFAIGLSLGLIWTPCVGPILASVISLALTGSVTGSAAIITLAYAVGTAIPMLAIIYGGRTLLQKVPGLMAKTGLIQKIFGVIMIMTAGAIFFNFDRSFQVYILEKFPSYGTGLTSFEDNDMVKKQLNELDEATNGSSNLINKNNSQTNQDSQPKGIKAPELILGGEWLNSEPLNLAGLKGKVVLLDFMTYTCINCIRTFPYLEAWHKKYQDDGLVVIGIHTPEFEFEKDPDNVKKALADFGLTFPVMQDNNYATWSAYSNRYWPRKYLIDHNGYIVYDHIGEGNYDITEKKIQEYLGKAKQALGKADGIDEDITKIDVETTKARSPETYFGSSRNHNFGSGLAGLAGDFAFSEPDEIKPNTLYLVGDWRLTGERAENLSENAKIIFKYQAQKVFLVTGADQPTDITISLDGQTYTSRPVVNVQEEKLYRLVEEAQVGTHTLEITITGPGLMAFAFTFG